MAQFSFSVGAHVCRSNVFLLRHHQVSNGLSEELLLEGLAGGGELDSDYRAMIVPFANVTLCCVFLHIFSQRYVPVRQNVQSMFNARLLSWPFRGGTSDVFTCALWPASVFSLQHVLQSKMMASRKIKINVFNLGFSIPV